MVFKSTILDISGIYTNVHILTVLYCALGSFKLFKQTIFKYKCSVLCHQQGGLRRYQDFLFTINCFDFCRPTLGHSFLIVIRHSHFNQQPYPQHHHLSLIYNGPGCLLKFSPTRSLPAFKNHVPHLVLWIFSSLFLIKATEQWKPDNKQKVTFPCLCQLYKKLKKKL